MTFRWARDGWHTKFRTSDKWYHFFGCALIFDTLRITRLSDLQSFLLTLLAGLLYEVWQATKTTHYMEEGFSWRDFVADIGGAVCAWLWVLIFT